MVLSICSNLEIPRRDFARLAYFIGLSVSQQIKYLLTYLLTNLLPSTQNETDLLEVECNWKTSAIETIDAAIYRCPSWASVHNCINPLAVVSAFLCDSIFIAWFIYAAYTAALNSWLQFCRLQNDINPISSSQHIVSIFKQIILSVIYGGLVCTTTKPNDAAGLGTFLVLSTMTCLVARSLGMLIGVACSLQVYVT